ncbi:MULTISPECIES: YfjI family protein [Halomonadaceae]|uniref:DUF3987 domain-containing protein n=1 Tax=Vreelandella titanicae TaxID=664683 RepID=A0AAP9SZG3_9GAMM|nr:MULTISPECIES: YfjI family protein [Halomonas]QKS23592.1 hypothetical protein FX987_01351 [Halomonas titanicae]CDG55164.1 hypothetical protein HALA3H3_870011 [Halomonas sp. A3H3]SDI37266.1 Protein of unknown function [Halomonas titanicae]
MYTDEHQAHHNITNATTTGEWPKFKEHSIYESIVNEVSSSLEIDDGMARAIFLSSMATVVQNIVDIEKPNKHLMPTSIFVVVTGESGCGKTPLLKAAFEPIEQFQSLKMKEHYEAIKVYNLKKSNYDIAYKELEKIYRLAIKEGKPTIDIELHQLELVKNKPKPPNQPRFIYEDITPSALSYNLYKNVPFGCLASSEADGVFNGKVMQDITNLNSIWSGSPIIVDRKTSEDVYVEHPRCSLSLMLQPERMQNFLNNRGKEAKSNGFLARLIFMQAESTVGNRTRDTTPPDGATVARYSQRCKELLESSFDALEEGNKKYIVKFSPSAKSHWKQLNLKVEHEMLKHRKYCNALDHANKLMDNVSRIAAILHTFEGLEGDIKTSTLDYAFRLCEQFSNHYLQFIAGTPEIVILANQLARDIRRLSDLQGDTYTFTNSLIAQRGHNTLRSKSKRSAALDFLEKMGHLIYSYDSKILFKETIIHPHEPELKNGLDYYIEELTLYRDQELKTGYDFRPEYKLKEIPSIPIMPYAYEVVKPTSHR